MQVVSYLTFNGNCREAMKFYHKCLGGKLDMMTVGESPMSKKMPVKMKNTILHALLKNKKLAIMGSDMVGEKGLVKGNSVALMLDVKTEKEMRDLFRKLSKGGEVGHKIEYAFFGGLLGDFTDKFGVNWVVHCHKKKPAK